ncbi:hypothetical protein D3C77_398500 [compost metagenome]
MFLVANPQFCDGFELLLLSPSSLQLLVDDVEVVEAFYDFVCPFEGGPVFQHKVTKNRVNVGELLDASCAVQQREGVVTDLELGSDTRHVVPSNRMNPKTLGVLLNQLKAMLSLVVESLKPRL